MAGGDVHLKRAATLTFADLEAAAGDPWRHPAGGTSRQIGCP
ncbi:MAG TPA: hypothetical protein VMW75_03730 [Thermoanaerobaculia bacterium]|nr:hypothetical protein [Thermoanaerobaculia bacterium]